MHEYDCDHETFTNEELLAEIGLDAYAIRTEAKEESEDLTCV